MSVEMERPVGHDARASEVVLRAAFARASAGLGVVSLASEDLGRLIEANAALLDALGAAHADANVVLGELVLPEARASLEAALTRLARREEAELALHVRLPGSEGRAAWGQLQAAVVEPGVVAVVHVLDVTDRQELATHLRHLTEHDELTGLASRRRLLDQAELTLARSRRTAQAFGVLHLDVEGLDVLEALHGAGGGDALLALAGKRLSHGLRAGDVVARVGGDEFAVLLQDLGAASGAACEAALETLAARVTKAFTAPFELDGRPAHLSVRIGTALFPRDGRDVRSLLAHADGERRRAGDPSDQLPPVARFHPASAGVSRSHPSTP